MTSKQGCVCGCATCTAKRLMIRRAPGSISCSVVIILKLIIIFSQGASCFHNFIRLCKIGSWSCLSKAILVVTMDFFFLTSFLDPEWFHEHTWSPNHLLQWRWGKGLTWTLRWVEFLGRWWVPTACLQRSLTEQSTWRALGGKGWRALSTTTSSWEQPQLQPAWVFVNFITTWTVDSMLAISLCRRGMRIQGEVEVNEFISL